MRKLRAERLLQQSHRHPEEASPEEQGDAEGLSCEAAVTERLATDRRSGPLRLGRAPLRALAVEEGLLGSGEVMVFREDGLEAPDRNYYKVQKNKVIPKPRLRLSQSSDFQTIQSTNQRMPNLDAQLQSGSVPASTQQINQDRPQYPKQTTSS